MVRKIEEGGDVLQMILTPGSPTLLLPLVGEVTEGTLCVVGSILGGLGVDWVGGEAGRAGGEAVYDFVTRF